MIRKDYKTNQTNSNHKIFRNIGPLDRYIYKDWKDEENVQPTSQHSIPDILLEEQKKIHIFTDGACSRNGKPDAKAAWAFLCVDDTTREIRHRESSKIPLTEPQTNQRAELQALLNGLIYSKGLPPDTRICIWSDSQYAINCASVWGPTWKQRGWTKQGGAIQHLDIIKPLVETTRELGFRLEYKWLKGHKGGDALYHFPWMFNHAVDELATNALSGSRPFPTL